jgi:hypothetical protein
VRTECVEEEGDMLVQWHTELLGAAVDVVAADPAGKAFVLELLLDARDLDGRTSAQAWIKPASSSTAKSATATGVSRGTPL